MCLVSIALQEVSMNGIEGEQNDDNIKTIKQQFAKFFESWPENDQNQIVQNLLSQMTHYQHSQINLFLKPLLQRDLSHYFQVWMMCAHQVWNCNPFSPIL